MIRLSQKTAYWAVATAARRKWAKPLCFGVYWLAGKAYGLGTEEKPFSRRAAAIMASAAIIFAAVPPAYAAVLSDNGEDIISERISTSHQIADTPDSIAERLTLEGLSESNSSYKITLNISSLETEITARLTSSDKLKSDIKTAFEGYGINAEELCVFPVKIQLYRNDTRRTLRLAEGYSADVTFPVPEEMYGRIDELRAVRLEAGNTLTVIEGKAHRTGGTRTFTFRTDSLGVFALVTYKDIGEDIGSGSGTSEKGASSSSAGLSPILGPMAYDNKRLGIKKPKRIYHVYKIKRRYHQRRSVYGTVCCKTAYNR